MRIDQRFERIVGDCSFVRLAVERTLDARRRIRMMLLRAVKPIRQRRLSNPGIFWSHVIRHEIEKNLHALLVRFRDEFLIVLNRSKMRIDRVQIHRAITVIILSRAIF